MGPRLNWDKVAQDARMRHEDLTLHQDSPKAARFRAKPKKKKVEVRTGTISGAEVLMTRPASTGKPSGGGRGTSSTGKRGTPSGRGSKRGTAGDRVRSELAGAAGTLWVSQDVATLAA
jgi:hypothetical protein